MRPIQGHAGFLPSAIVIIHTSNIPHTDIGNCRGLRVNGSYLGPSSNCWELPIPEDDDVGPVTRKRDLNGTRAA